MYDEYRITLSLVPDGIFDIEKKAWQMTASKAVAQVLKECYGGVAPKVLGVTAMHALRHGEYPGGEPAPHPVRAAPRRRAAVRSPASSPTPRARCRTQATGRKRRCSCR